MISKEENELLCRTGPGTPMGELFRRLEKNARSSAALKILRDVAVMPIATIYRSASGEGQELAEIVVEAFG